jgi:hypothetical protein
MVGAKVDAEEENELVEFNQLVPIFRDRAKSSRRFAKLLILFNVLIVAAVLILFFSSSNYSLNTQRESTFEFSLFGFEYKSQRADAAARLPYQSNEDGNGSELEKLKAKNQQLIQDANERVFIVNTVGQSILRFGSVLLAVYLMQIIVNFTRYHFRIADHLSSVADSLELTSGDITNLGKVVDIVSPKHIDFGAPAKSINDNVTSIIKDAISKIPSK